MPSNFQWLNQIGWLKSKNNTFGLSAGSTTDFTPLVVTLPKLLVRKISRLSHSLMQRQRQGGTAFCLWCWALELLSHRTLQLHQLHNGALAFWISSRNCFFVFCLKVGSTMGSNCAFAWALHQIAETPRHTVKWASHHQHLELRWLKSLSLGDL